MQIRLLKPLKGLVITFEAELLARDATRIVVRAPWTRDAVDVGLMCFEPGDVLVETYYTDRWYNIWALYGPDDHFKGWYCNLARPAIFADDSVETEDLELDLLVTPDRSIMRLDDEDEYAARNLAHDEPATHAAVLAAVQELRARAATGVEPFTDS